MRRIRESPFLSFPFLSFPFLSFPFVAVALGRELVVFSSRVERLPRSLFSFIASLLPLNRSPCCGEGEEEGLDICVCELRVFVFLRRLHLFLKVLSFFLKGWGMDTGTLAPFL